MLRYGNRQSYVRPQRKLKKKKKEKPPVEKLLKR